jgi:hypothetical protein
MKTTEFHTKHEAIQRLIIITLGTLFYAMMLTSCSKETYYRCAAYNETQQTEITE